VSAYPEEAVDVAVALPGVLRRYRDLDAAALVLFMESHPVPEEGLRQAFVRCLDRMDESIGAPEGSDDPFDRAEDLASRAMTPLLRMRTWRARRRRLRGVAETPDSAFRSLVTNVVLAPLGGEPAPEGLAELLQAFDYREGQNEALVLAGTALPDLDLDQLARRLQERGLSDMRDAALSAPLGDLVRARECLSRLRTFAADAAEITFRALGTRGGLGFGALVEADADPLDEAFEALSLACVPSDLEANELFLDAQAMDIARFAAMRRIAEAMSIADFRVFFAKELDALTTPPQQAKRIRRTISRHLAAHPDDAAVLGVDPEPTDAQTDDGDDTDA